MARIDMSELKKVAKRLRSLQPRMVKDLRDKIALDAHRNLVLGTPVDTNEARGGWQVELGPTPYSDAEIVNNVEHVEYLIDGSSPQADANYDIVAVIAAVRSAK